MLTVKHTHNELNREMAKYAFPGYLDFVEMREIVDDCIATLRTMEEKQKYLPPTKWQQKFPEKYAEFLFRALFPGETKYSTDIYTGLFNIGEPQVKLPDDGRLHYLLNDASVTRDGLKQVQIRCNNEQMSHGLRLLLLEVRQDAEKPFFIQEYTANQYLRAHFTKDIVYGESICDVVLLNESGFVNDIEHWEYVEEKRLRILALDRNMEYYQRSVTPEELGTFDLKNPPLDERTVYPAYLGKRFDRIPLVWCGAKSNSATTLDNPQLLSMAQTELKLFLCMAHNSQHIYMNTQESIVITGTNQSFKLKDDEFVAGSVVVIPGEHAQAQYLSTNGIGFDAEEKEIERLLNAIDKQRLSLMSAKSHQSGTVVGLVQNSQSAPLRTVVTTSGNSITLILQHAARWMGYDRKEVEAIQYIPSEAFANPRFNLSEYIALCKSVASGEVKMLEEDLYLMAKESHFITGKLTWEQFKEKYDIEFEERKRKQGIIVQNTGNPFAPDNTSGDEDGNTDTDL
jgi:hypothetical protein